MKTILEKWMEYRETLAPDRIGETLEYELKAAFFGGAIAMFSEAPWGLKENEKFRSEITAFIKELEEVTDAKNARLN